MWSGRGPTRRGAPCPSYACTRPLRVQDTRQTPSHPRAAVGADETPTSTCASLASRGRLTTATTASRVHPRHASGGRCEAVASAAMGRSVRSSENHLPHVISHPSPVTSNHSLAISHQTSGISHQSSVISHQSSGVSRISHQSTVIRYQSPVISHQSPVIPSSRHPVIPSSVIRHPSFVIRHPASVISHQSFIVHHQSSAVSHHQAGPQRATCHLWSSSARSRASRGLAQQSSISRPG